MNYVILLLKKVTYDYSLPRTVVLNQGLCPSREILAVSENISSCTTKGCDATGISWVVTRNAIKHSIMHAWHQHPHRKNKTKINWPNISIVQRRKSLRQHSRTIVLKLWESNNFTFIFSASSFRSSKHYVKINNKIAHTYWAVSSYHVPS